MKNLFLVEATDKVSDLIIPELADGDNIMSFSTNGVRVIGEKEDLIRVIGKENREFLRDIIIEKE